MTADQIRIKHWGSDDLIFEKKYNTFAGRFFPFDGVEQPDWGGAWVAVAPDERTTPHGHQEKEMFFVISGRGVLRMGAVEREVGYGDTVYVTPGVDHDLTAVGPDRLVFLDVWWDTPEEERGGDG
jgi:mannose-6-phosphate isomerase-like protein (cupin superfamily)